MTVHREGVHMAVRYPNLTTKGAGPNGTGVYLEIGLLHLQRDLRTIADTLEDDGVRDRLVDLADTLDRMTSTLDWQTPRTTDQ